MIQPSNPYTREGGYVSGYAIEGTEGHEHMVVYDLQNGAEAWLGKQKGVRWVVMHQPSKMWTEGKGRDSSLRMAKEIAAGTREADFLPKERLPGGLKPPQPGPGTDSRTRPGVVSTAHDAVKSIHETFDSETVANLLWQLCNADRVYSVPDPINGGTIKVKEPDWNARARGADLLLKYKIGTPAKQKDAPPRAPLTLEEMRRKMTLSPEYRAAIQEMLDDCAKAAPSEESRS